MEVPDNETILRRFEEWLREKGVPDLRCPICGHNDWGVGDMGQLLFLSQGGGLVLGGPVYAVVAAACANCAHMLLFNAVQMGLLSEAPKENQKPAAETGE